MYGQSTFRKTSWSGTCGQSSTWAALTRLCTSYSISKLEFLDEVEELELVLDHYCVAWGVKLPASVRVRVESGEERLEDVIGVELG